MNLKKLLLILVIIFSLSGCTNINDLNYDDIINNISLNAKKSNVFKKGFNFYLPRGLDVSKAGPNYVIISSSNVDYYMYLDLISFHESKKIEYEENPNVYYSQKFSYNDNDGYVEIKLWENNKYLIEIMYNYAKIEVMVEENLIKEVLINSINILNSIKYNNTIIESLLKSDNLDYTEELFNMFENIEDKSNVLNYEDVNSNNDNTEIKDTDYVGR